jgi:hypothetical protein
VIYKIPPTAKGLPEGIPIDPNAPMPIEIAGAIQGVSGFRRAIYRGPAPPPGKPHHYHFIVYALDADLGLKPGLTRADLLAAINGHVIGQGEIVSIYERKDHDIHLTRDLLKRAGAISAAAAATGERARAFRASDQRSAEGLARHEHGADHETAPARKPLENLTATEADLLERSWRG